MDLLQTEKRKFSASFAYSVDTNLNQDSKENWRIGAL